MIEGLSNERIPGLASVDRPGFDSNTKGFFLRNQWISIIDKKEVFSV